MKKQNNAGYSLIEVLVAIALLGALVVPISTSLVMGHRMNLKATQLLEAQLAVSSAVETLMAEGISHACDPANPNEYYDVDEAGNDRFPDVKVVTACPDGMTLETPPYFDVIVTSNDDSVSVTTTIRAGGPDEIGGEGDGE